MTKQKQTKSEILRAYAKRKGLKNIDIKIKTPKHFRGLPKFEKIKPINFRNNCKEVNKIN